MQKKPVCSSCLRMLIRLRATKPQSRDGMECGQLELRSWADTHLRDGQFDQHKTLALFAAVVKHSREQGFPLIRFVTHMEWALENRPGVDVLSPLCAKPEE